MTARFSSFLISHAYLHIKCLLCLTLPFNLTEEMCELYYEFTLENVSTFTSIPLRRSEHRSENFAAVCLTWAPSIQIGWVEGLGAVKMKKNPLIEKSPVRRVLPRNCWWCCCPQVISMNSTYEPEIGKPAMRQNQHLDKEM